MPFCNNHILPGIYQTSFGLTLVNSTASDGRMRCHFQRKVMAPSGGTSDDVSSFYTADADYWVMLAWRGGNVTGGMYGGRRGVEAGK